MRRKSNNKIFKDVKSLNRNDWDVSINNYRKNNEALANLFPAVDGPRSSDEERRQVADPGSNVKSIGTIAAKRFFQPRELPANFEYPLSPIGDFGVIIPNDQSASKTAIATESSQNKG